ncbi:MFS general substrate transporter [Aspergillus sclerotiicarbonarius CBS 121057]|uniref:MFS general substrate transporter n=1 Tax=Aspergillus sclerotiicarbonarius (strain CBS 121057 / IBT 28362) TaxID=1448318 RepID=A0A319EL06_ASPSB|nr:MFS general substrate transporter [Aspergillus sclerotiicarbonarius CBS 121057]
MLTLGFSLWSPARCIIASLPLLPHLKTLTFQTVLSWPSGPTPSPAPDLTQLGSPYKWSPTYKWALTVVSCVSTLFASFAARCYSPGAEQMASEWQVSQVAALVGITTFCCGFAIGPMFLVPFSEIYGRKPVFVATAILFTICQLCCSVTRSYPGMLVARFFCGVGGSTFSTMVGGIVVDIFHASNRNTPMALFSWAALFGTGLDPLVGGFIGEDTTWRWIFYIQIIVAGAITLAVLIFFRETRGPAPSPEKVTMPNRWNVAAEKEHASILDMIRTSLLRPFTMLLTEPVVFFFSLWAAFSWSVLYINLSVIPLVFQSVYGLSLATANAIFAASCIGTTLALFLSIGQETIAARYKQDWNSVPEHRLYCSCIQSLFLPIGLFLFGWSAHYHLHWMVSTVAVAISTIGIFSVYLSVFNYLADGYHRYASSALAAQSSCRNIMGGVFPLVSRQMFDNMGFGAAASLLGAVGAGLTLVPWVLVRCGPRIRRRSRLARERMDFDGVEE